MVRFGNMRTQMMKRVLIIYPHWPPSNLVGVHRVRLIANELIELGWLPTVLTVDERDYEEPHDQSSLLLVDDRLEVIKVRALAPLSICGKRIIGDIGLRALCSLNHRAIQLCKRRSFDCVWISIPSWYTSIIGRNIWKRTKTPYGIDFQDPWVHELPPNSHAFGRASLTLRLARLLEPFAVAKSSFITGINRAYFEGCISRNPQLQNRPMGELQLGFSEKDHSIHLQDFQNPWADSVRAFVYAGAFLPMSLPVWNFLFRSIAMVKSLGKLDNNVKLFLFGTGQSIHKSLTELSETYGLDQLIIEQPQRIPFLEVQEVLRRAEGVLLIGSTEKHYSASKTFQGILSGKKILSICHHESEAREILMSCSAGRFHFDFLESGVDGYKTAEFAEMIANYFDFKPEDWQPNTTPLWNFSAKKSAEKLVNTMNSAIEP
jgi:hypothetical protein